MNENVIEEQTLTALKNYLIFLNAFPSIVKTFKMRSDEYQKSDHQLLSPPDIQALTHNAASNKIIGLLGLRLSLYWALWGIE